MEFDIRFVKYRKEGVGVEEADIDPNKKLALETCPNLDRAIRRAITRSWDWQQCPGCGETEVQFQPIINRLNILGNCPDE